MYIYLYDLKIKDKKKYNTIKRRFYYHFNKKLIKIVEKKTKSVILIDERYKKEIENFFAEYEGVIEVYRVTTQIIEKILEVTPSSG